LRVRRGLSQADVARDAGITQATVSNYEKGVREVPLSTLLALARILNLSLGDLLESPEVIVVRDSALGRAVREWQADPAAAGHVEAAS